MAQLDISHAQLAEIWAADEPTAKGILSRMAKQHNYASDLRQSIYVDFLHSALGFAKTSGLSPAKALAVFGVMVETHAKACADSLSKEEAFGLWSGLLMAQIQALPAHEAMTLAEVQRATAYATADYFNHFALHLHAFTHGREGERRRLEMRVETAATPLPLAGGTPVVHAPATEDALPSATDAAAADEPVLAPAADEPAVDAAAATSDGGPALDAAVARLVEERVEAARVQMVALFDERERELVERIGQRK